MQIKARVKYCFPALVLAEICGCDYPLWWGGCECTWLVGMNWLNPGEQFLSKLQMRIPLTQPPRNSQLQMSLYVHVR